MTSSAPPSVPLKLPRYSTIVAIFILIEVTGIFEQVMVYVAIPTLMGVFSIDAAQVSWAITVFLLVGAATAAVAGRLGDLYGRKKMLIILMVISAIGSIISLAFGTFEGILVGRALQGTSAAIFPLLVGIAREVVPAPRVPVLVSITTGTAIIGGALSGLLAGILLDLGDWRLMFLASAILAVVALIGAALVLPLSTVVPDAHSGRLDILGAIVFAPAVAAILYGVNTSRAVGWGNPLVLGLVIGGAALFAFWIVWELKIKNPMFNLRLFRNPALVLTAVATATVGLGIFAATALMRELLLQGPAEAQVGLGLSPTEAGLWGLIGGVIGFVISPFGGKIASKFGAKVTTGIGLVVSLIGFFGLAIVDSLWIAIAATVIISVGTALVLAGLPNLVVEAVPPHNTGEAVGLVYGVGRTLFAAIGTAIVGMLLASSVEEGTTHPTLGAWYLVLGVVVVLTVLSLVATLMVKRIVPMDKRGDVIEAVAEAQELATEDAATPSAARVH